MKFLLIVLAFLGSLSAWAEEDAAKQNHTERFDGEPLSMIAYTDTLRNDSLCRDSLRSGWFPYGFSRDGLLPHRQTQADRWRNIPEECRFRWSRPRKHFLFDFVTDVSRYLKAFDTTYVSRNRYDGMLMLDNLNLLQRIRIAGRNADGRRQVLTLAPVHTMRLGPYGGWLGITLGYSFGIVPDRYGSRTFDFSATAYAAKLGFDFRYTRAKGNFNLVSASGFEGIDEDRLAHIRLEAMTCNTTAINLYYVFNNHHFSYPAAMAMTTVQLRSAGSWLMGVRYDRQRITFDAARAESVLQQLSPKARLMDELRFSSVNYRQISLSLGYAYNFVPHRGWLISLGGTPLLGYKYQKGESLSTHKIWRSIRRLNFDFIFRAGLVWTNGRYYVGGSTVSYLYDYRDGDFHLTNSFHYLRLYLGFYFHRQKKFKGKSDFF